MPSQHHRRHLGSGPCRLAGLQDPSATTGVACRAHGSINHRGRTRDRVLEVKRRRRRRCDPTTAVTSSRRARHAATRSRSLPISGAPCRHRADCRPDPGRASLDCPRADRRAAPPRRRPVEALSPATRRRLERRGGRACPAIRPPRAARGRGADPPGRSEGRPATRARRASSSLWKTI